MTLKKQQGSTLLVALVLIFLMSILGASAMQSSTLERRMATNAVQAATVRQAAESATDLVLKEDGNMNGAWNAAQSWHVVSVPNVSDKVTIDTNVAIRHTGDGLANGYSAGSSGFMSIRFVTQSDARVPAINSVAGVEQGIYRIVPNPN